MTPLVSPIPHTPLRTAKPSSQRLPSPGYFGLVPDPAVSPGASSGGRHAKGTRSPPLSVRSAAASSPQPLHHTSSPTYDTFRDHTDSRNVSLSQFTLSPNAAVRTPGVRPSVRRPSKPKTPSISHSPTDKAGPLPNFLEPTRDEADGPRSPKRHLTSSEATFLERNRSNSQTLTASPPPLGNHSASRDSDAYARLSLNDLSIPPSSLEKARADTLPAILDHGSPVFAPPQVVVNILDSDQEDPLLLDLRVSTHYAKSRIRGALNLCIPTTLLKRSSYNAERLAETFKLDADREKFQRWRQCTCIIVYDTNSTQTKDASNCTNILKKFQSDGCDKRLIIIRGGFLDFSRSFASFVDETDAGKSNAVTSTLALASQSSLPPVIGGCPMPPSKSAANPFFGNIRQNMDLIGGVGQMPIALPSTLSQDQLIDLPKWLRIAADTHNHGKIVSDKFLNIEKREQARMNEALSDASAFGSSSEPNAVSVQVAGIEKGSKNRYNNIYPFEHSRVKLKDAHGDECDYVNASYVRSSLSSKRYIATQGPIPHTFVDFWKMVWQNDVRVIVMLTAESEGGQIKAHNYWSDKRFGPMKLSFLSEHHASLELVKIQRHKSRPSLSGRSVAADQSSRRRSTGLNADKQGPSMHDTASDSSPHVIVRKFTLAHEHHPFERLREITQLQYTNWPDFGIPAHPAHLLGLVEQCDIVTRYARNSSISGSLEIPTERPVLVHCSAGCGRTGTFCTVDTVIDALRYQRSTKHKRQVSNADRSDSSFAADDETPANISSRDDIDLIEKVVEEFRRQRLSMVQSLRQFVLCYETVLEWVVAQTVPKTA